MVTDALLRQMGPPPPAAGGGVGACSVRGGSVMAGRWLVQEDSLRRQRWPAHPVPGFAGTQG